MWLRGRGCGHHGPSFELRSIFQQFCDPSILIKIVEKRKMNMTKVPTSFRVHLRSHWRMGRRVPYLCQSSHGQQWPRRTSTHCWEGDCDHNQCGLVGVVRYQRTRIRLPCRRKVQPAPIQRRHPFALIRFFGVTQYAYFDDAGVQQPRRRTHKKELATNGYPRNTLLKYLIIRWPLGRWF